MKLFILLLLFSICSCYTAVASPVDIYEMTDGKPKQSETISVRVSDYPNTAAELTANVMNNVDITTSTVINKCPATALISGIMQFSGDFADMTEGDFAYIVAEVTRSGYVEYSPSPVKIRYGYPYTTSVYVKNSFTQELTITGNGYGANTGLAAVVVADNATYSSAVNVVTQTGVTWTPTELGFVLDKGAIPDHSTAYVFVRDADGAMYGTADVSFKVGVPHLTATVDGDVITLNMSDNVSISAVNFFISGGIVTGATYTGAADKTAAYHKQGVIVYGLNDEPIDNGNFAMITVNGYGRQDTGFIAASVVAGQDNAEESDVTVVPCTSITHANALTEPAENGTGKTEINGI